MCGTPGERRVNGAPDSLLLSPNSEFLAEMW
jgi:hypothetical protein